MRKTAAQRQSANLSQYRWVRHDFNWRYARRWMAGLPDDGGINIGYEAVDRHAGGARRDCAALHVVDRHGATIEISYGELRQRADRFANLLTSLGMRVGGPVHTLLGPCPELFAAALGTMRRGDVYVPLSPSLDEAFVRGLLHRHTARVLLTTPRLYQERIAAHRALLPALTHVLLVGDGHPLAGTIALDEALAAVPDLAFTVPATSPEQPAMVVLTRGTTGSPKPTLHHHGAVLAQHATALFSLDLRPGDIYWCTADPGSIAGTAYGLVAPLSLGATVVLDTSGSTTAARRYAILAEHGVTVCYTEPDVLRAMRAHSREAPWYELSALRHLAATGAPLTADLVEWSADALGAPAHDTWCQAEAGAIAIGNYGGVDIVPGALGLPEPGVDVAIVATGDDDRADLRGGGVHPAPTGSPGLLAIRSGLPSMFQGYLDDASPPPRPGGWQVTDDVVECGDGGYYRFVRRAGHRMPAVAGRRRERR
ncbi:AMP-binding protein [Asanoa sp. NPDC049518]|uniref:AMP-binding protein n=1 Tax=unclassified Asanoa TaxID=2685164 RepID=UPI0034344CBD